MAKAGARCLLHSVSIGESAASTDRLDLYCVTRVVFPNVRRWLPPYGLRHACATHLMERRAELRHIQELLGHASVATTQIYTHVSIGHLKETLQRCHPRERGTIAE